MHVKFGALMLALVLVAGCQSSGSNTGTAGGAGFSGGSGFGSGTTAAPGSQEDLVQSAGDRVFFDFDRYDLKGDAQATLDKQAAWLKQNGSVTLVIEGHCDERGTREYNLALGERRATAVKNYLVAAGVDASRLGTISYGKERPAVEGSNEAAWAKNRRAVSVVTSAPRA